MQERGCGCIIITHAQNHLLVKSFRAAGVIMLFHNFELICL
jgi:hypothetical protein